MNLISVSEEAEDLNVATHVDNVRVSGDKRAHDKAEDRHIWLEHTVKS